MAITAVLTDWRTAVVGALLTTCLIGCNSDHEVRYTIAAARLLTGVEDDESCGDLPGVEGDASLDDLGFGDLRAKSYVVVGRDEAEAVADCLRSVYGTVAIESPPSPP
jgi:hypothetical protein